MSEKLFPSICQGNVTLNPCTLLAKYCFIWVSNSKRLFTSKLSSVSAEIIAASYPGPAIGRTVFGVASSSTDDLSITKACFAGQTFGSFVKGAPLRFCGDSQLLWCLPCWMLAYY